MVSLNIIERPNANLAGIAYYTPRLDGGYKLQSFVPLVMMNRICEKMMSSRGTGSICGQGGQCTTGYCLRAHLFLHGKE